MDLTFYKDAITGTMDVINSDADSILKEAERLVKGYLETNTSLTDNEAAKVYAKFVTDVTDTAIAQAISAATQMSLEGDLNEQRILNLQGELAITQEQSDKDLLVKDKQMELDDKRIDLLAEDILLRKEQVILEGKKVELMAQQILVETEKIALIEQQVLLEAAKIPLLEEQTLVEHEKIALITAQALAETEKIELMKQQALVEAEKIPLMQAQVLSETAKVELITQQTEVEKEKIQLQRADIQLRYADVYYRQQQARTVAMSLVVNERIEGKKNETQLKVATIQASAI